MPSRSLRDVDGGGTLQTPARITSVGPSVVIVPDSGALVESPIRAMLNEADARPVNVAPNRFWAGADPFGSHRCPSSL